MMDGKPQQVKKKIKNNKPNTHDMLCGCTPTSTLYRATTGGFARCDNGATHCTRCLRTAHKFRKGWTCGIGCTPYEPYKFISPFRITGAPEDTSIPWIPSADEL